MSKFKGVIKKTFVWGKDPTYNGYEDGWLESNCPGTYFPAGSLTLAHDVLEHTLRPKAGIESELRAFGAMIYTRAAGGYFKRHDTSCNPCEPYAYNVAFEIVEMLQKYGNEVKGGTVDYNLLTHDADYYIEDLEQYLFSKVQQGYWDDDLPEPYTLQELQEVWPAVQYQLQKGYLWADRKYSRYSDSYHVCSLFKELEAKVEKIGEQYEGTRLYVTVDIRNGTVDTRLQ